MRNCENTEQLQRNRGYHVSKKKIIKRFIVFLSGESGGSGTGGGLCMGVVFRLQRTD